LTVCDFGSEPKPGSPTYYRYLEADIGTALPPVAGLVWNWVLGLPSGWLSTADFCSTQPVGDLPTTADYIALAFPPIALLTGAYGRFRNQVLAWKFSDLCQCSGDPTPGCVNTSFTSNGQVWAAATAVGVNLEWGSRFTALVDCDITGIAGYSRPSGDLSARDLHLWDETGTLIASQAGFPTPAGHWQWTFTTPIPIASGLTWTVSETTLSGSTVAGTASGSPDMPGNAYFAWGGNYHTTAGGAYPNIGPDAGRMAVMPVACDSGESTPIDPPPDVPPPDGFPDPVLGPPECNDSYVCSTLYKLDQKVELMATLLLELIQRLTPYRIAPGATYSGLTGSGSIAAPGILGVRVTLTTVPPAWGSTTATPIRWIPSPGDILFDTAEGLNQQHFLHYDDELLLDAPPMITDVAYTFRPGVVGTIQLLAPYT
jgi:hypothetical protein